MRYLLYLVLVVGGLFWWAGGCQQPAAQRDAPAPVAPKNQSEAAPKQAPAARNTAGVPAYVVEVLDYVKQNHRAPAGFVGGRTFENRENRLPATDEAGNAIRYQEWDVNQKVQGQNRGAERLITGSDKSARYTKDHYRTFIRIE
jgi:guanyl-specific ribonuclease Sa